MADRKYSDSRYSIQDNNQSMSEILTELAEWHKGLMSTKSPLRRESASSVLDINQQSRRARTSEGNIPANNRNPWVSKGGTRVKIPSTKATSRVNEEEVTDSLKLYEEQIRNYVPSDGKRPLSLCFDFIADDAHHSSSSSSTMSSSSSGSNSQGSSGFHASSSDSREELFKQDLRSSPLLIGENVSQKPQLTQLVSGWNPSYINHNEIREDRVLLPGNSPNSSSPRCLRLSRSSDKLRGNPSRSSSGSANSGKRTALNSHNVDSPRISTEDMIASYLEGLTTTPEISSPGQVTSSTSSSESSSHRVTMLPTNTQPTVSEEHGGGPWSSDRYDLSSLDMDYRALLQVNVLQMVCRQDFETEADINSMSDMELGKRISAFRDNRWGLGMSMLDGKPRVAGSIRIFMNLIKPIKMSLQHRSPATSVSSPQQPSSPSHKLEQQDVLRSSPLLPAKNGRANLNFSPTPDSPGSSSSSSSSLDGKKDYGAANPGVVSFFLPRGTPKLLHITSSTTSDEVIEILLKKFLIQESPRKFALFEHTLESEHTVLARKLDANEQPLVTLLGWAKNGRSDLEEHLKKKRIVLQENENSGEINWQEFSVPELQNFLRILDKEEADYREAIILQYGLMRRQMLAHLESLQSSPLCPHSPTP